MKGFMRPRRKPAWRLNAPPEGEVISDSQCSKIGAEPLAHYVESHHSAHATHVRHCWSCFFWHVHNEYLGGEEKRSD